MKNVAVMCSGGDAPGMNCAIRAVVRSAISYNLEIFGIKRGYQGLLEGDFISMNAASVGNIMQHGGTILQTSRCLDFHKKDTRKEAYNILKRKNIDGLVVIGGNGSFQGAYSLSQEHDFNVVGIPGTIDNDISGTDYSIGFDTAVQTAVNAVDKIRDTAHSHARTFIVEVMGRNSSAIAQHVGICTGAENIILPHNDIDIDLIVADIEKGQKRGKQSSIIICAEGPEPGFSYTIREKLLASHNLDSHVCILGHIQRGGNPSSLDRYLASKMGYCAILSLLSGEKSSVTSYILGDVKSVAMEKCLTKRDDYMPENFELIKILSI